MRMSFLGVFTFNAPYLPLTLIGFTVLVHNKLPWADLLGFAVGHTYYFLQDVYPYLPSNSSHVRPLEPPLWLVGLVDGLDP